MMTLRKKVVGNVTYYQIWRDGKLLLHLGNLATIYSTFYQFKMQQRIEQKTGAKVTVELVPQRLNESLLKAAKARSSLVTDDGT